MTTLNVSLPDAMRDFIQEQIQAGSYSTVSEYLRYLIRQEQKRVAQEKLDAMLLEGLNSGESVEMTDELWDQMRSRLVDKLQQKAKNG
ncbi:type II toxin-antitoxin system ParD family antitoxin [Pseudanabaena sp. UWO310]|uniref:type II toxin-antitoxin system ParD family antitoxin n=1 Tax=Pseudanabaena sp. UWO310 TaxID=2480795 RepID=UPI00115937FB|nr:type II toxin-antitoxin system ParD family antitoxin [Pseudanabaena sp. UWO310]TYQ32086.1 type II toxin-antitoxin system ParD family antitoxin [Pseudanabaena sp. UWO310]